MSQHSSTDYVYEFYQIHVWFFIRFSLNSPTIAIEKKEKKNILANPTEKIKVYKGKKNERKSDQTKWETISFTFQFISIQLYCIDKEIELITQIRSQCQSNNMMEILKTDAYKASIHRRYKSSHHTDREQCLQKRHQIYASLRKRN